MKNIQPKTLAAEAKGGNFWLRPKNSVFGRPLIKNSRKKENLQMPHFNQLPI